MELNKKSSIFVAGHRGLVGQAVVRSLEDSGYSNLILRSRKELDLLDQNATKKFFDECKPEFVIDCAARVGGINANIAHPAEFLYDNLQIQNNLIWGAKEVGVSKFVFISSSCIYPKQSSQPMKEEYFMQGPPEPANAAYAHAKIAGMKLCEFIFEEFNMEFVSCTPTNIYGPGASFDPETSHVIPSLLRRVYEAKQNGSEEVVIWGTGNTRREFLHVDDLASAVVFLLENYKEKEFLNIGTGEDVSIRDLAFMIKEIVGYEGELVFDSERPDGIPRRLLDVSKISNLGWKYSISLEDGLKETYDWYLEQLSANQKISS